METAVIEDGIEWQGVVQVGANPHENPGTLISFPTITSESSLSRRGPLLSAHFASGIEARGVERILENQGESKMFGIID